MNKLISGTKRDMLLSWMIGIGIGITAFQSKYFPGLYLGFVILLTMMANIVLSKEYRKRITFGSPYIYAPLAIIIISMILSSVIQFVSDKNLSYLASCLIVAFLYSMLYLSSRMFGQTIFKNFKWIVILESLSVIVYSLFINFGAKNGGVANILNYNIAVGILVLGAILAIDKHQWITTTFAVIGLIFTGAEEALFALAIIGIIILLRRDVSKRILIPIGLIIVIAVVGFTKLDYINKLYVEPINKIKTMILHEQVPSEYRTIDDFNNVGDYLTGERTSVYEDAFNSIKPFGNGYELVLDHTDPHNVPIIIMHQIGILASLAWIFLNLYLLIKTKHKYLFAAIFVLSIFDNFVWGALGVWWWAIIGVASVSTLKSDLIFKVGKC